MLYNINKIVHKSFIYKRWCLNMYNLQLETFLHVARTGSFTKAAEESYITPTAVIKQINLLEESLGLKLFERTHRGVILTKAGKSLYQDAKYIIQYCKDSVIRARNAMQEDDNVVRIGSSPMTPAQLLMPLWSKVQKYCPDIKFQIIPLWKNHNEIKIIDFDFYNMNIFNRCENSNDVLLAIPGWTNVHPLLKVIPVEWQYSIPYGLLHSPHPSKVVKEFLKTSKKV